MVNKALFASDNRHLFENKDAILLSTLKNMSVIDLQQQKKLKDYIDISIFALYFDVALDDLGLDKADQIRDICGKSPFWFEQ
ncbi:MAG: hypothetical protein MZV70_13590 [Desulfobacterales bacterium]|nr:hypothetical protein [Desulfobacterales bacterium]